MDDSRDACFYCGEQISLAAQVCPHCRREVLVTVSLPGAIQDGRLRYRIARGLAALGPPLPGFLPLQQALADARPVVATRVTRELARRVAAELDAEHISAQVTPAGTAPRLDLTPAAAARQYSSPVTVVALALLLVAVLVAGGWYAWRLVQWDRSAEARRPTSPITGPLAALRRTAAPAPEPSPLTTREIAERTLPATVSLRCPDSVASGFFIAPDTVLTNAHTLCDSGTMKVVLSDGRETSAFPQRTDRDRDLATLRLTGLKGQPAPLGDAGALAVGDKVVMIGSPVGLEFTVHEGSVSSLSRSIEGVAFIQIDAKVNPGNSGGPLLDDRGRVVGVVSRKHALAEGIGLALPINYAYPGMAGFASPAPGVTASMGFQAMVARAKAESVETEQGASVAAVPQRGLPMVVATAQDRVRRLVVYVALPARLRPEYRKLAFDVRIQDELLCTVEADFYDWTLFEGHADLARIRPDLLPAIRKRTPLGTLYLGSTPLDFNRCPKERMRWQTVVTLRDADPGFSAFKLTIASRFTTGVTR